MKVLVLLSRFPYPLEKGDKLRGFHQIKELSKQHEIVLIALSDQSVSNENIVILKKYCSRVEVIRLYKTKIFLRLIYKLLFSKESLQVSYFYSKSAQKKINSIIETEKPNHIYCQLVRVSEYVKNYSIKKTLDYMDALARGMERRVETAPFYIKPFFKIETTRLKRYEHDIFNYFENKTIITKQDKELIVHIKNDNIVVVPNGVSYDTFKIKEVENKFDLIFTGNMSYPPNVEAAVYLVKEIMPIVWRTKPDTKLAIVGANPDVRISLLKSKQIEVTGWVNDISDYYSASKVFVAPMFIGTGLQNKLLEAMAMKLPCITSELVNNALGAKNDYEILIGKSAQDFSEKILTLLKDNELYNRISENGYNFVKQNYTWEDNTEILNQLITKN
ncbi:MAG: glycosyltransferase [Flavobacteriales bacterium]|nr:glycosyltransferase [Flavobacteriales bacterium]